MTITRRPKLFMADVLIFVAFQSIGRFVARSIADKVVTKAYLDRFFSSEENYDKNLPDVTNDKIQKAVESARLLVNMNDHLFQLSHTWGNKGGFLAVKELSDKINELIQEYHDSGDVEEAIRCLKELNVPHFHHEFVYETLDFSLQKASDHSIELFTTLLKRLCETVVVTYDQLKMVSSFDQNLSGPGIPYLTFVLLLSVARVSAVYLLSCLTSALTCQMPTPSWTRSSTSVTPKDSSATTSWKWRPTAAASVSSPKATEAASKKKTATRCCS